MTNEPSSTAWSTQSSDDSILEAEYNDYSDSASSVTTDLSRAQSSARSQHNHSTTQYLKNSNRTRFVIDGVEEAIKPNKREKPERRSNVNRPEIVSHDSNDRNNPILSKQQSETFQPDNANDIHGTVKDGRTVISPAVIESDIKRDLGFAVFVDIGEVLRHLQHPFRRSVRITSPLSLDT